MPRRLFAMVGGLICGGRRVKTKVTFSLSEQIILDLSFADFALV